MGGFGRRSPPPAGAGLSPTPSHRRAPGCRRGAWPRVGFRGSHEAATAQGATAQGATAQGATAQGGSSFDCVWPTLPVPWCSPAVDLRRRGVFFRRDPVHAFDTN